jgi:hypothetical protein
LLALYLLSTLLLGSPGDFLFIILSVFLISLTEFKLGRFSFSLSLLSVLGLWSGFEMSPFGMISGLSPSLLLP